MLWWVKMDPMWDGTPVWHLVDRPQPTSFERLMRRLKTNLSERVSWLEDEFLPGR